MSRTPTSGYGTLAGEQEVVLLPQPAAGADWTYTLPGGYWKRLLGAAALFTTSGTVANRFLGFRVTDGTNILFDLASGTAMTATLAVRYAIGVGANFAAANASVPMVVLPIPSYWLQPGYAVSSITANLQAADQWSRIALWFERLDFDQADQHSPEGYYAP